MNTESELPPPPYSEVDPSTISSNMGGGEHSPSSTLRPTSSSSMRSPSFITLRGGYLRGVPFSEDDGTHSYFQDRTFQFDPNRGLTVLHREITANTTRSDLPFPEFDADRDVLEEDWQTFVNYILTEIGNETSSRKHHKKTTAEEFYEKQTKLEQLVAEWNEAFFGPRSIKFIAHYYYAHPKSPAATCHTRETRSELRRIPVEDATIELSNHNRSPLFHAGIFGPEIPSVPLGSSVQRRGPNFGAGRFGRGRGFGRGFDPQDHRRGGRVHHDREYGRRRNSSVSSNSSSSSASDDNDHGRRRRRQGGRQDHRHQTHRRRDSSSSSESALSSVSSISSDEMDEHGITALRSAIANFRLDPTNNQHNRMAYRQLLQSVRNQKKNATSLQNSVRTVSKAQRKAIKDDFKDLRKEAKQISKDTKNANKDARKQAKAAVKQAKHAEKESRKQARQAEKAARKIGRSSDTGRDTGAGYQMPGAFPEESTWKDTIHSLENQIRSLEQNIRSLEEIAEETREITYPEKKTLARAAYDEQIKEMNVEITRLQDQITNLHVTHARQSENDTRNGPGSTSTTGFPEFGVRMVQQGEQLGRHMEAWGERFGRDMENWGETFGRDMERWGQQLGQRMGGNGGRG